MHLVSISRDALLKPLMTVVGILERRHTLPILANVFIRKTGSQLAFIATDLEVQITTHTEGGVGAEQASLTVAGRKLLDILKALPESGEIRLALDNHKLSVQSNKSRFNLQTLPVNDYPCMKQPQTWQNALSLTQKTLRYLLNMVHFAMAQQDIRYYLNGMLLVFKSDSLQVVATDGHRLAYYSAEVSYSGEDQEIIVPRKTILELLRLLQDNEEMVSIEVASGNIRFCFDQIELLSKLVEGKFPDFTRVIPNTYSRHFNVNRDELQACLQRAAILTTDKFKGVHFQLANHQMKISSSNAEQEEAREEIEIEYDFEPLDIGFNVNYLLEILHNIKTEQIVWSVMPDVNASALITLPNDERFKYVVMPMRI